jgi:signal transduction histidine kinase
VDASPEGPREESLRFALRLVRELGGVVQSRFLLGRLRSRIGAMERARVARELHDGTIQSLVGAEMEVDVLRRRADQAGLPLAGDLARVQGLLRSEVLELRDTMQRLKPIEITPEQLVGFLDATVARFGQDTGLRAIFDCAVEDVDLAPRVCREIGRIVQEALQNVRKHSGGHNVLVRFGRTPSGWRLVVDDDGRGFPFQGVLGHVELDEGRQGPYVVKERVRALGGELTITSSAGGGARLEILLPREAR